MSVWSKLEIALNIMVGFFYFKHLVVVNRHKKKVIPSTQVYFMYFEQIIEPSRSKFDPGNQQPADVRVSFKNS